VLSAGVRGPARARADEGMTLIELVISIGTLAIMMPVIAGALYLGVQTQESAGTRLGESADQGLAASYFAEDVHGSTSVAVGETAKCGTTTPVVEFVQPDFDVSTKATTTRVTAYVRTGTELHRRTCVAATASPAYPLTPASEVTVARSLATTNPTVKCDGVTVSGASCATTTAKVELGLVSSSGDLTFTLAGVRRTS
jgi:hypothetical protein